MHASANIYQRYFQGLGYEIPLLPVTSKGFKQTFIYHLIHGNNEKDTKSSRLIGRVIDYDSILCSEVPPRKRKIILPLY